MREIPAGDLYDMAHLEQWLHEDEDRGDDTQELVELLTHDG